MMKTLFPFYVTLKTGLNMEVLVDSFKKADVHLHAFLLMEGRLHLVLEGQEFRDVFSGRLKGSVLTETLYYQHILKYIYLLPKKKGLVERVEHYPFSGLHERFPLDIRPDLEVDKDFLNWVNKFHTSGQEGSIVRGLRYREFRFSGNRRVRRPPFFESYRSDLKLFETFDY